MNGILIMAGINVVGFVILLCAEYKLVKYLNRYNKKMHHEMRFEQHMEHVRAHERAKMML